MAGRFVCSAETPTHSESILSLVPSPRFPEWLWFPRAALAQGDVTPGEGA